MDLQPSTFQPANCRLWTARFYGPLNFRLSTLDRGATKMLPCPSLFRARLETMRTRR